MSELAPGRCVGWSADSRWSERDAPSDWKQPKDQFKLRIPGKKEGKSPTEF